MSFYPIIKPEVLEKYSCYFKKLNRGVSGHLGKAPHKPVWH